MQPEEQEIRNSLLKSLLETGDGVVAGLKNDLGTQKIRVSDVFDTQGHQYVNLVQEGGGVLGIALLGYTYVMECMGIRFLKLAGTSAGAINAALMAVVRPDDPATKRSPIILYYLTQKNLFDFVDGHPIARWLLKSNINYKDFLSGLFKSAVFTLLTALSLVLFSSMLLWKDNTISVVFWGLIVAYLASLLLFKRGLISNGIITKYLLSRFFLGAFGSIILLLLTVMGLATIPNKTCGWYQEIIALLLLLGLLLYTIWLGIKPKREHSPFIQWIVAALLSIVLADGILNKFFNIQVWYCSPFIREATSETSSYQYLSVSGMSLFIFFALLMGSISIFLYARFSKSRFGINPGDAFKNWIADLMENGNVDATYLLKSGEKVHIKNPRNGIRTLRDLEAKLKSIPPLVYRPDDEDGTHISNYKLQDSQVLAGLDKYEPDEDEPPLALITTEIVTENKIIFPKMWRLFYADKDHTSPADFVRASMSIPFFFEAFRLNNIPKRAERANEWMQYLSYDGNEIKEAVFIDGGSISNFPINVFSPTRAATPRLPTFGARLDDEDAEDSRSVASLGGLGGSIINTMRANYDKDFLITHPQFEDCLACIDVRDINWLNFNLPPDEQIDLFRRGAIAAANFLLQFNWELFKAKQEALNLGVLAADIRASCDLQDVQGLIQKMKEKRGM
ncbi:MAG: hypothetical protein EAZ91_21240 [Cytophagales bacterium]|nr:MAG: hypothetical protein EAZ91_21240 [Cytophagales bacterium]